jgi:heptaprenyl diphosphate synthase
MKSNKLAYLGIFTSLALILSFVESQIPPLMAIPGVKLGIPNIAILFILYKVGWKEAALVNLVRVFIVGLLFGSLVSIMYSFAGAFLSLFGMILLKKSNWFSCVTVSVIGGILHNVGQIIMACLVTVTSELMYYLPVLIISGTVAGILIGIVAGILLKRMEKFKI